MAYYVIGIGGTGARCIESFVHLVGTGVLKDRQDVHVVYVDADVSCGNLLRAQNAVNEYEKARKTGFVEGKVFCNAIQQYEVWNPVVEDGNVMNDIFHREYLLEGGKSEENRGLGMLLDALFTKQERETNLDRGFRGHPAIGATVINQQLNDTTEPWATLKTKISSDKDAKIFLMGSVFGGTGAAGFPTIARLLKKILSKDSKGCVAKISGALILPYFQFPRAGEEERQEMQAKVEEFMLNTKSALDYYNKTGIIGDVFDSVYMVGDNELAEVKNFSLGSNSQKNPAHFIELYAALGAMHFFNDISNEDATTYMIARSGESDNKIEWEDLPNICVEGTFRDKMATYIKYLYMYSVGVFPSLSEIARNQSAETKVAWYMKLVQKAGGINVYKDRAQMAGFESLQDYAKTWYEWMYSVVNNDNRILELIDANVYTGSILEEKYGLDASSIVLPKVEGKNKLERSHFWNKLCTYSEKKTSDVGAAVLMHALYNIANE